MRGIRVRCFSWAESLGLPYVELVIQKDKVTIVNSYKIKKCSYMVEVLEYIKKIPDTQISKRSVLSMLNEWRAHNLLYWLGIKPARTRSCDLDSETKIRRIIYTLLSLFYIGQ